MSLNLKKKKSVHHKILKNKTWNIEKILVVILHKRRSPRITDSYFHVLMRRVFHGWYQNVPFCPFFVFFRWLSFIFRSCVRPVVECAWIIILVFTTCISIPIHHECLKDVFMHRLLKKKKKSLFCGQKCFRLAEEASIWELNPHMHFLNQERDAN